MWTALAVTVLLSVSSSTASCFKSATPPVEPQSSRTSLGVQQFSATSPAYCFSDYECGPSRFCQTQVDFQPILPICKPRIALGATCDSVKERDDECVPEAVCDPDQPDFPWKCIARPKLGEQCDPTSVHSCAPPLVCVPGGGAGSPAICRDVPAPRAKGMPCGGDADCRGQLACVERDGVAVCGDGLPAGASCAGVTPRLCQGFCRNSGRGGDRCGPMQPLGGLCLTAKHCQGYSTVHDGGDFVLCNARSGGRLTVGTCQKASRLLRRLGDKCDPKNDRCDASRGLKCVNTARSKGFVCQHCIESTKTELARTPRFGVVYCEPGSPLSWCAWGDAKTECRLENAAQSSTFTSLFYSCVRQRQWVARGGLCVTEYAQCARGTNCRRASSVTNAWRTSYCVRLADAGEACDNFRTGCRGQMTCDGVCRARRAEDGDDATAKLAGNGGDCAKLACAPGLVCRRNEAFAERPWEPARTCQLPRVAVGRGRRCGPYAENGRICKGRLVCRRDTRARGPTRCRHPKVLGDLCGSDAECARGLKCSTTPDGDALRSGRCFDPRKQLPLGALCKVEEWQCGDSTGSVRGLKVPVGCMSVPGRRHETRCQVKARLFDDCGRSLWAVCVDEGVRCSSYGMCVPS